MFFVMLSLGVPWLLMKFVVGFLTPFARIIIMLLHREIDDAVNEERKSEVSGKINELQASGWQSCFGQIRNADQTSPIKWNPRACTILYLIFETYELMSC